MHAAVGVIHATIKRALRYIKDQIIILDMRFVDKSSSWRERPQDSPTVPLPPAVATSLAGVGWQHRGGNIAGEIEEQKRE